MSGLSGLAILRQAVEDIEEDYGTSGISRYAVLDLIDAMMLTARPARPGHQEPNKRSDKVFAAAEMVVLHARFLTGVWAPISGGCDSAFIEDIEELAKAVEAHDALVSSEP